MILFLRPLAPRRTRWYQRALGRTLAAWLVPAASMILTAAGASPAQAALPADRTTSGIDLAQPFNNRESIVDGTMQGESGVVDYVWGAVGDPGDIPGGSAWHETYFPWGRDPQLRPISWWLANHPTWVMYTADGHTPATLGGQPSPILDTTNPQVQAWIERQEEALLASGFDGISWDNGVSYNAGSAVGHFDANGQWVQQYSGDPGDSAYANAQAAAFAAVTTAIKSAYPNTSDTLNQPFGCDSVWSLPLASTTDMLLDEQGFTNYGNATTPYVSTAPGDGCRNDWLQRVQEYVRLQKNLGKGLVLLNEEPYPVRSYMTDTNHRARADLQWALANYLLVKYSHTYFWWGGVQQYGGAPLLEHEYTAPVGSPVGDVHPAEGVYMRDYTHGLAIVNPDPTRRVTVTLPSGYRDLYGEPVARLAMPPHSGIVLTTASHHRVRAVALRHSHHRRKATWRLSRHGHRSTADMGRFSRLRLIEVAGG